MPLKIALSASFCLSAASAVSGFAASVCSLPFLNLAYAINAVQTNEKLQCKSFLDCILKSFQIHGKMILYKGFTNQISQNVIPVMVPFHLSTCLKITFLQSEESAQTSI